jgi:hypothetical protein
MVNNPNGVGGWQPGHAPQQVEAFALFAPRLSQGGDKEAETALESASFRP